MNNGLFDLTNFESMNDNDIMYMSINESGEFAHKNPDTNHPEEHFEKDGASGKETSIPVPSKVTLSSDQYNAALNSLKKSFKEGYEIMEMLENASIGESIHDKQNEFIENAILDAMESGPLFESLKRDDKSDVKEIVKKLRPEIYDYLKSEKIKFYKPSKLVSLFINPPRLINQLFNERLWQNLGVMVTDDVDTMIKKLNNKFKSELGDYKIVYYRTPASIVDIFRVKFNFKNFKDTYMLLVDKKFPSDLKKAIDEDNKNYKSKTTEEDMEEV